VVNGSDEWLLIIPASCGSNIPLLAEQGWRDSRQTGAPGAKREPDRAKPQLMVSSAETFRRFSIEASHCRLALRATPSAPSPHYRADAEDSFATSNTTRPPTIVINGLMSLI